MSSGSNSYSNGVFLKVVFCSILSFPLIFLYGEICFPQSSQRPDLSTLNFNDRESIQSVCLSAKLNLGPAAYNKCLQKQLNALAGSHYPDLSTLSFDDRESIQSVCLSAKLNLGPTAYNECLQKQLNRLNVGSKSIEPERTQNTTSNSSRTGGSSMADPRLKPSEDTQNAEGKLAYFVGTWILAGDMKSSPFGPAGKLYGTRKTKWMANTHSLLSYWDEHRPSGDDSGSSMYLYDSVQNTYTYAGVDRTGEREFSIGKIDGKTWTWTSSTTFESGQSVDGRFLITELSTTSYSFKFEIISESGEWTTVFEGVAEKVQ